MRLSSSRRSLRSLASSDDSGSSISVTAGSRTSARPIATRCIWPPDSLVAGFASLSSMRSIRATSVDLAPHFVLGRAPHRRAQRKREVVEHVQVRVQRVLLEHEGHVAQRRRAARSRRGRRCAPCRHRASRGPATRRSVVVLPAPLGPSSTMNSPAATSSVRSRTACTSPKRLADALEHAGQPWAAPSCTRPCATRVRAGAVVARGAQRAAAGGVEQRHLRGVEARGRPGRRAAPARRCRPGAQRRALRGLAGDDLAGAEVLGAQHLGAQRRVAARSARARAARRTAARCQLASSRSSGTASTASPRRTWRTPAA